MALTEALRQHREAAGLSLAELTYRIRDFLPRSRWVSLETVRRIETGFTPESKVDLILLTAIAEACQCRLADLSPDRAEEVDLLRDLLIRTMTCIYRCGDALTDALDGMSPVITAA